MPTSASSRSKDVGGTEETSPPTPPAVDETPTFNDTTLSDNETDETNDEVAEEVPMIKAIDETVMPVSEYAEYERTHNL